MSVIWFFIDTADTFAVSFIGGNFDVSFVTPRCTPWVFDNNVWCRGGGIISYSCDTMIKICSTFSWTKYSTVVILEYIWVSFNTDGKRTSSKSGQELVFVVCFDGFSGDLTCLDGIFRGYSFTFSSFTTSRFVWISFFSF